MKKIFLLSILIICTTAFSIGQSGYYDMSSMQKKYAFQDDFNDNKSGWSVGDFEGTYTAIEYGYMVFRSKNESTYAKWKTVYLNENNDWELEWRARYVAGEDNNFLGLAFGCVSDGNKHRFGFAPDGHYTIDTRVDGKWVDVVSWTKSSLVSMYDWNKFTVRKVGGYWYYFLNETLVHTRPAEKFYGKEIGLYANSKTTVNYDYVYFYEYVGFPPTISWLNPNMQNSQANRSDYTIRVKITSVGSINSGYFMHNGFPTQINSSNLTQIGKDFFYEKNVTLQEGNNEFSFSVTNSGGESVEKRNVFLSSGAYAQQPVQQQQQAYYQQAVQQQNYQQSIPQSDVDVNIPENPKNTYRFALIIGNEDYASYQRTVGVEANVAYAVNDALKFKEYCIKTLGVEERNVFYLANATTGAMNQNIDLVTKIASKLAGKAEIIFYYAGHGLPDEITKVPYLIPVDVNAANLSSAVKLNEVYQKFSDCGAKRITVFLDACFSGGGREAGLLSARSVRVKPKEEVAQGNLVVFTASSGEQSSLPYKEKGHGMFTYWVLKHLQQSKGKSSYGELARFVNENVSVESLRTNYKEQDPQVNVSPSLQATWKTWTFF